MFQWSLTLSDRQVLMLMAFHNATPDQDGNCFNSVRAMIADAWDIRAVRNLQAQNLLSVEEYTKPNGQRTNKWSITDKGDFICLAIQADTEMLHGLQLRQGLHGQHVIGEISGELHKKKMASKKK